MIFQLGFKINKYNFLSLGMSVTDNCFTPCLQYTVKKAIRY